MFSVWKSCFDVTKRLADNNTFIVQEKSSAGRKIKVSFLDGSRISQDQVNISSELLSDRTRTSAGMILSVLFGLFPPPLLADPPKQGGI